MISRGFPELLIMLAMVLVVIGPGRLVGIGAAIATSLRSLRAAGREPPKQRGEEAEHLVIAMHGKDRPDGAA